MKPHLSFLLVTFLFSLFVYQPVQASRSIVRKAIELDHSSGQLGSYKALIIGIDEYDDPDIPDLQTAVHDAKAMAKVLKELYGFETRLLLNKQVTQENLSNSLRELASESKAEDSILIYYAGHGDLDRKYNDGWWIPVDARSGNPVTFFDNVQIQKAMRSMTARHVLIISDSCYSGSLFGSSRSIPPVIDKKYYLRLYNEKSRWGLTSGNKKPVQDRGTEGHSVFAYQLLKELRGTGKKIFSIQELYARIAPIIGTNSDQTPLCRPFRNTGDQGGEFVFVRMAGGDSVSDFGRQMPEVSKDVGSLIVNSEPIEEKVFVGEKVAGEPPVNIERLSLSDNITQIKKSDDRPIGTSLQRDNMNTAAGTIKLGVAGVQSGDLAVYGLPTVNAAKVVVAQYNAKGGINGRMVELLIEDDICKPEVAINTANKLVEDGVHVVLGHICNTATTVALPIYQKAGVVVMSPSANDPALTQSRDYPNFFRTIVSDDAQAKTEVNFAIGTIGAKKIAVIHDKSDYGKGLAEFAKTFILQSGKAEVVLFEAVTPGAVDYTVIVQKIKRSAADAVIFGGYYPEASKIVSMMKEKDLKTVFISDDGVKDHAFIKVVGENAEGVYVSGLRENFKSPLAMASVEAHKKTYNAAPGAFYENAYSAVLALLNAIEKAGSTEMAAVTKALQTEKVETPVGIIYFDEKGDAVGIDFAMYQVQNGEYVEVK